MDCRKAELTEKIREHRLRLEDTLTELDERFEVLSRVPAKVKKIAQTGRSVAVLMAVATVVAASIILVRDLFRSSHASKRRRLRWN